MLLLMVKWHQNMKLPDQLINGWTVLIPRRALASQAKVIMPPRRC